MTLHLETDRLTLRPPAPQDADTVIAFYESKRSEYTGGHVDRFQAWKNTAAIFGHWTIRGFGLWAVTAKDDDTVLGMVGPFYPESWPETEIGWLMFDGAEGKGYAFEAAKAAISDARARLGWSEIVHYIDPQNARSIALAERLGAALDQNATPPKPDQPCLIYRQPEAA